MEKLAALAKEKGKNNIAFMCLLLLQRLGDCVDLLIETKRFVGDCWDFFFFFFLIYFGLESLRLLSLLVRMLLLMCLVLLVSGRKTSNPPTERYLFKFL